jgi:3-oxoacyl-[acyl-carrier protein] reductase
VTDTASLGLDGRIVVVTGAGRGFGERIAQELAGLGARVAALDIDGDAAARVGANVRGLGLACDVSIPEDVERAFAAILDELGAPDVLVNNAGIASSTPFLELTAEEWDRLLSVDLTSMMLCAKQVVPAMVERRFGRIVNMSSIAGKRGGGFVGRCAYAAAKAGVLGFTKALARELAPHRVTVNAVAPGAMDTEMTKVLTIDPEVLAKVIATIPMGYRGAIQDASDAVVFLCSDLASYLTGETINVDGGLLME